MYKVMIVEDEMLVRIGLKNSVDWSKFGMEVASDFPDGQAAWNHYQQEKPDLIITDLSMPKMDGMTLIGHVRKADRDTRIVVLSCLEEFELARKALSLGVSGYILKLTMTEQEIESVLNAVRRELEELPGRQPAARAETSPSDRELIKEKMFKDFLFYNIFSAEEFGRFAVKSNLRLSPVRLRVCLAEVDRYDRLKNKFRDEHGHLIKMTLLNLFEEVLSAHKRGEAVQVGEKQYALVLHFEDLVSEQAIARETEAILDRVQEVIRLYFNGSVSFGVSGTAAGYESLPGLYAEAHQALGGKFLSGPGRRHREGEAPNLAGVREKIARIRGYEKIRTLLTPIALREYDGMLDYFEREAAGDRRTLELMTFRFVQAVGTSLYDSGHNERTLLHSITENLEQCDNLPDMLDQAARYIEELASQEAGRLQMSDEIQRALAYIKRNYAENIGLQTVADHVGLSPGYLSNLFKKELQTPFVDYLNRYRIERAKELLMQGKLKPSDIPAEVGFSPEYTYFSKVFKKVTGLNPNEYRRQMLTGSGSASVSGERP
ncbi:DNA-binding response regulator [Saccharibacillus sp. O23]|uniref:response regulator n=1 Tax=Saccharibacillus sp. O23 TaxID=2009338 RepID=UPI000B4E2341|nr:response regulator [Saccharibacillus sp. O23]OWR30876.1 DNA-binding response regulator [Saccharibacillus sp. O23]